MVFVFFLKLLTVRYFARTKIELTTNFLILSKQNRIYSWQWQSLSLFLRVFSLCDPSNLTEKQDVF